MQSGKEYKHQLFLPGNHDKLWQGLQCPALPGDRDLGSNPLLRERALLFFGIQGVWPVARQICSQRGILIPTFLFRALGCGLDQTNGLMLIDLMLSKTFIHWLFDDDRAV